MDTNRLLIDEEFLHAALTLVAQADHDICISTFKAEITTATRGRRLVKLFQHLFEKSRRGANVRIMINQSNPRGSIPITNLFAIGEFKKNGIKVRSFQDTRICHAKILIVDHFAAILGSHNLSVRSCHNNFETSYLFYDGKTINELRSAYEWAWGRAHKA